MISPTRPTTEAGGRLDRADGIARVLTAPRPGTAHTTRTTRIARTTRRDRTAVRPGITGMAPAGLLRALPSPRPACGPLASGAGGPR